MKYLFSKIHSLDLKEMLREYAWLCRYSLHYKVQILWYIFTGILGTAVSLVGSIVSKQIIDAVTGFNSRGILAAMVFFVLMQLSQILFHAISGQISTGQHPCPSGNFCSGL